MGDPEPGSPAGGPSPLIAVMKVSERFACLVVGRTEAPNVTNPRIEPADPDAALRQLLPYYAKL